MFEAFRKRRAGGAGVGRREALRVAGGAFSGAALAGLMQTGMTTRSAEAAQADQCMDGLWRLTTVGGQTVAVPFYELFHSDGSVVGLFADPRVCLLGRWMRTGERTFVQTLYLYRRDTDGASVGLTKSQARGEMNDRFDRWVGEFKSVFYDNVGAVVENRQGTIEAIRLYAEPFE
jgi:hypothetical protein